MTKDMEPELNVDLLSRVVEFAVQHAQRQEDGIRWNQSSWRYVNSCGTSMCVAGIACQLTDAKYLDKFDYTDWVYADITDNYKNIRTLNGAEKVEAVSISSRACNLFGLVEEERHVLFDSCYSTPERLYEIVDDIKNGKYRQ